MKSETTIVTCDVNQDLPKQIAALQDGDHLCLFYERDPAEQMPALVPFIREGLSKDEQFIYVADDQTVGQLTERLEGGGINVAKETAHGRLKLWIRKEWRQPGLLSSEKKAAQVCGFIEKATKAGFKGIRLAVEMTWTLGPDISAERLEHWEATINTLFTPDFPARIICQYNRSRLSPEVIVAALRTHPRAIVGKQVCNNIFYDAKTVLGRKEAGRSKSPLSREAAETGVDWMVSSLVQNQAILLRDAEGQRRAAEASAWLAAIVDHSDDAIVGKNLEGVIQSWNKGAERIFGYTAEEVIGKPVTILIPPDRHDEEPEILRRIRCGERIEHFETIRTRKDEQLIHVSLTVSPVKDSAGRIIGASKIARDITDRTRYGRQQKALYGLLAAVNCASDLSEICDAAVDAVRQAQDADRAAILLMDDDHVMRFKASVGLSEEYCRAVEGHSPWKAEDPDPQPVLIDDVAEAPSGDQLREIVLNEGIRAVGFIPLVHQGRLLGKFMIYYNAPHRFSLWEVRPAQTIGSQVVFAIERQRSGEALEELVNERTKSLREAMAQMEEFSYTVSHDLRGPLRRMQFYSEMLLQDFAASLPEEAGLFLRRIAANATRLDRMVLDVLTFSQMTREELRVEQVAVEKLVRQIVEQYPGMQPPQAEIETKTLPDAMGHEALLTQVFSNLLSNATKFVRPGVTPKVSIWSQRCGEHLRFWVADNGIGIDPRFQHRLFNLFERIDPASKYEGTGIGLAIVRKAVERMSGKVGVESDGKNGSRFWFEIRAAEQPGSKA